MTERYFDFGCCPHCGCAPGDRVGHDDTCQYGCNDFEMVCPQHGIPDCSPLLNGCNWRARVLDKDGNG